MENLLARKALQHFQRKSKVFTVTSMQDGHSNCMDVHLCIPQEEADIQMILHSLNAVQRGVTKLYIESTDTNVFVLSVRHYHQLCKDTSFITGVWTKKRIISMKLLVHALGKEMAPALPEFHAFSRTGQTG